MKIHGLELDDEISVVRNNEVTRARVKARAVECLVYRVLSKSEKWRVGKVDWDKEGIKWCRGWSGLQVDALKTVVTLSESTS